MPRKRKFNPNIPAHIDQAALPVGVYWGENRWFILEPHPEGGGMKKRTIAYASARLSELHAFAEQARGGLERGTLVYLLEQFRGPSHRDQPDQGASEYRRLAKGTRDDYDYHGDLACAFVLADGSRLGDRQIDRINVPMIQRLVEVLASGRSATPTRPALPPRPSTANHVLRFLRRLFAWGIRHGHCTHNPARGVRQADEAAAFHMPEPEAFQAVLKFARERAFRALHSKGSVPPYMPAVMILAYNARLRGIEVTDLTDANKLEEGVLSVRRKGSLDTITPWNHDLRWAWDWLEQYREKRTGAWKRPVPIKPDQRQLLVTQTGTPLARSSLKTAWQRLITAAIAEGVIAEQDRFNLHGLKHRGITDTAGTRADKQDAAGHVDPRMTVRYNHQLAVVPAPRLPGKGPADDQA